MKIYQGQHRIVGKNSLSPGEIQLAYVDTTNTEKIYRVLSLNHKSTIERRESVFPYEKFNRPDPYLFDKNNNLMSVAVDMIRNEDQYEFFPAGAVEFFPEIFDFRVSIKRQFYYDSSKNVNLKVGVIEKIQHLQEPLIKIFGDAYRKNLITSNFKINDGDLKIESLTNSSILENDIVFIESEDLTHYWDGTDIIHYDEFLDQHTNIWLCAGDSSIGFKKIDNDFEFIETYAITGNKVYKENVLNDIVIEKVIDETNAKSIFPQYEYIETIFKYDIPVAIFHKKDKGYIFVSHKSVVLNAEKNYKLIYEMLNYIYTRGYEHTKWISGWITDNPVDYIPRRESIFGRNHEKYLVHELLDNRIELGDTFHIVNVEIMQGAAALKGIGENNEIFFEKTGDIRDPVKATNQRSYYATNKTIILYTENSVNRLEMPLTFRVEETEKGDYMHIDEFKSTALETNITEKTVLRIPDTHGVYCVVLKENFFTIARFDSVTEEDGYVILVFESTKRQVTKSYDTRIAGGGLPASLEPNYNLFDIGHLRGRPFRKGGTIVIELPSRIKEHESIIRGAIERHIVAGEHYILTYKEQEG